MEFKKILDETYYTVKGWMIKRLNLKGVDLILYSIIYGFSQDGESEYTGSLQYLSELTGGVSKPTIIAGLKRLVEKNYIIKREEKTNGVQFNRYKANLQVVKNLYWVGQESLPEDVKKLNEGGKKTLPNNKDYSESPYIEDIKIIVGYLNQKLNTKYKPTTKSTAEHINARLSEGFTVEDFKTVIDKKKASWTGTEYEKYLRPSTLFGTKFEQYLNEKGGTKPNGENGEAKRNNEDEWNGVGVIL